MRHEMEYSFTTAKGYAKNTPSWVGRTAWQDRGLCAAWPAYSYRALFPNRMTRLRALFN